MYFRLLTALAGMLMCASYAAAFPFAYITNLSDNTVSVIDTKDNSFVTKIPLGVGQEPFGVTVSADGKYMYVANQLSKNISVIDIFTDPYNPAVINTIPLTNRPGGLAINSVGTRLYVANNDALSVSVVDLTQQPPTVIASPTVGTAPVGVAINSTDSRVYVANSGSDTVSVIDTTSNTVSNTINVGSNPWGIAFGNMGGATKTARVFVANEGDNTLSVINDLTSPAIYTTVSNVGSKPYAVAIAPDGSKVYVSNASSSDSVTAINTSVTPYAVSSTYALTAGSTPQGIAVSPDGFTVYSVNNLGGSDSMGTVSSINVNNGQIAELSNAQGNPNPMYSYFFNSPQSFGNFMGPQLYTMTATAGSNGTISPSGVQYVLKNATPTYTIAPKDLNFRINNISVNGNFITFGTNDPNYNTTTKAYTYNFGAVVNDNRIDVTFIKAFDYVSVSTGPAVAGSSADGTVTSTPAGINCNANTGMCQLLVEHGATVTLKATPNPGKYFAGWVGDITYDTSSNPCLVNNAAFCNGLKTDTCTFVMDGSKNGSLSDYTHFTATFSDSSTSNLIRMMSGQTFYATVQAAFDAITSTTTDIQLSSVIFTESPTLNTTVTQPITLSGGWSADMSFGSRGTTTSTISGTLTIAKGTMIADNITIQ